MSDDFKSVNSEPAYAEEQPLPEIQEPDLPKKQEPGFRSRAGRFLAAVVMLALGVILALFAISLVITIGFGDVLVQPYREVGDLRIEQRTLQAQVAELSQAASGNNAEIATISAELSSVQQAAEDLDRLSGDLGEQIATASALQEEVGEERMNLAVIATVQSGRQEELARIQANIDELEDRTQSLVNFIERLNNLTADTTFDTENLAPTEDAPATPTSTPLPDEAEASTLLTDTPETPDEPTATPEADAEETEGAEETTATQTPRPTSTATATAATEQLGPPGPPESTPEEEANQPTSPTLQQAANPDGRTYIVQPGDTLLAIASPLDISVEQLRPANELPASQADTLQPK